VEFAIRVATLGRRYRRATPRRRAVLGEVFTPKELVKRIVEPSGLRLLQPLDLSISPETWQTVTRISPSGQLEEPPEGRYPLVLLRASLSYFTSALLVMEKPAAA
jgi:hypothetical protein